MFNDIKGHDNIKLFLKRASLVAGAAHSYLFFGPEGVGKTLTALVFAKALNCLKAEGDACGACVSCVKIENKNHPDVTILEPAQKKDSISIEQIRDLQEKAGLRPFEGLAKVFIVKEAHLMNEAAANCLLKTLEEPPRDSVIILITTRPEGLLLTVRSRCKQIRFAPLDLRTRLELAKASGLTDSEAKFLSGVAAPDTSFLGEGREKIFEYRNRILEEFISDKQPLEEGSFVFSASRDEMKFMISVLGSWFRDLFLSREHVGGADFFINSDKAAQVEEMARRYRPDELQDILGEIQFAVFCLDRNVGPKLAFNNLKLKFAPRQTVINETGSGHAGKAGA